MQRTPMNSSRVAQRVGVGRFVLWALALCCLSNAGCIQLGAVWANLTGGEVVSPVFELTKGPLLVLIDDKLGQVTEPRAMRDLHRRISDVFLEKKVNRNVVPFEDWQHFQGTARNYEKITIREIGEKLGAEQVLYLGVDRFVLQAEPGAPIFQGEFVVRVKVISTKPEADVRLWPRAEGGRAVSASTQPTPMDGDKTAAEIAKELSEKLGDEVGRMFYEHRALDVR